VYGGEEAVMAFERVTLGRTGFSVALLVIATEVIFTH
jgi:hypothetical protein